MVQDVQRWATKSIHDYGPQAPQRWRDAGISRFHIWVVRDPVDRYISAWSAFVCGPLETNPNLLAPDDCHPSTPAGAVWSAFALACSHILFAFGMVILNHQ
mgnify:CR=1 FL=1|jgi:hypothetical protein